MKELQRVKIMERLCAGELSNQEAAEKLGLCRRQVIRLRKKYREQGEKGVIHGNRGRRPAHSLGEEVRGQVLDLYRQKYYDFNFSHFTEWLNEEEGLKVSRSSVARILKGEGIQSRRSVKRRPKLHRSRPRRPAPGEMWQTDATLFKWFGEEEGYWTLHAYVDDATGIIVGAYFTENECMLGYVEALKQGVERYGLPMEIYSDRHTIFRSPKELSDEELAEGKERSLSNFGLGLKALGIRQTFARSPQGKGRVERLWGTLQDRLASVLRLSGITNIEEANRVLPRLLAEHNKRFSVKAQEAPVYVGVDKKIDFGLLFAHRGIRKTDSGGVISYKGCSYAPVSSAVCPTLARASVEVRETLDGRMILVHQGKFIELQKVEKPERANAPEVQEKRSNPVKAHKPAPSHLWRHSPLGKAKREHDTTNSTAYAP